MSASEQGQSTADRPDDVARCAPALTALVSTTQPWPELERVLEAVVTEAAACGSEVEVLVMDGTPEGDAVPAARYPTVRVVALGPADIFECRAAGVREATGDAVCIVEDHAPPLPGWAAATVAAHALHPDATVVVGSMVNGSTGTVLRRAAYALTLGPFDDPVLPIQRERMPVPANVSFKRRDLPPAPTPGWLEYEAPLAAYEAGRMAIAPDSRCLHVQDFDRLRGLTIQFSSGRAYGGSLHGRGRRQKLDHLRTRARGAVVTYRTSRRGLGRAAGHADRAALAAMVATHLAGQLTGLALGPGSSRDALR